MSQATMQSYQLLLLARLDALAHILDVASQHFEQAGDAICEYRLIDDMHPFGAQVALTCNQPYNFVRWCNDQEMENLSIDITTVAQAKALIAETKDQLHNVTSLADTKLQEIRRIDIMQTHYLELPGTEYVNDFLLPNFYFHLTTAYDIMRMKGAPLGKGNFMAHLGPKIKQV